MRMQYQQGTIGRIFVAKVEHGEDFLGELKKLAKKENIKSATLFIIGALKSASMVVGPQDPVLPPQPMWRDFDNARELVGMGTIFWDENEPLLHVHGVFGKGDVSLMGCIRAETEVYLILEIVIFEITGVNAVRQFNETLGLKVLTLK